MQTTRQSQTPPPPLLDPRIHALFLDFDGTLIAFAETPDAITLEPRVRSVIAELPARFDQAFAFVTGRGVENLRSHVGDFAFSIAGGHGAEWSLGGGDLQYVEGKPFDAETAQVSAFAERHPATVLEIKSGGVTLHYRRQPELEKAVFTCVEEAFGEREDFDIMPGHMMLETRRRNADKGRAIERFMARSPFAGRVPVFIGDDVTDEFGFEAVNRMEGISVRVGSSDTCAKYRLNNIDDVLGWLEQALSSGDA